MKSNDKDRKPSGNVLDLSSFRRKKETEDELSPGRKPLYVSHSKGKVTGSPHFKGPEANDFGDRLTRIRSSLEKINKLMSELKKMSSDEDNRNQRSSRQK